MYRKDVPQYTIIGSWLFALLELRYIHVISYH